MEKKEVVEVLKWFSDMGVSDILETNFSRPSSNKISTLAELKEAMAKVDISIKHCATNMVFGMGNTKADILLLGEAPGAEEDKQGLPFVGQSGQLLDKVLADIGLDRTKVYITNILPWRPPGNRTPNTQEVALFRPYVLKHISLINPKVVVCLGGTSTKALLQTTDGIMKLHGRWTTTKGISAKIMPTFHPAYLLRSPSQKREFWRDFLLVREEISTDQVN
ncbi:MAG: uracil-DNA glycosylase [Alphaproteobacteria bacterium]|nr:uracil-DNA glycosylase [Alphaproteobacteria bacterium]